MKLRPINYKIMNGMKLAFPERYIVQVLQHNVFLPSRDSWARLMVAWFLVFIVNTKTWTVIFN